MQFTIEFFRLREDDDARAALGRITLGGTDLDGDMSGAIKAPHVAARPWSLVMIDGIYSITYRGTATWGMGMDQVDDDCPPWRSVL